MATNAGGGGGEGGGGSGARDSTSGRAGQEGSGAADNLIARTARFALMLAQRRLQLREVGSREVAEGTTEAGGYARSSSDLGSSRGGGRRGAGAGLSRSGSGREERALRTVRMWSWSRNSGGSRDSDEEEEDGGVRGNEEEEGVDEDEEEEDEEEEEEEERGGGASFWSMALLRGFHRSSGEINDEDDHVDEEGEDEEVEKEEEESRGGVMDTEDMGGEMGEGEPGASPCPTSLRPCSNGSKGPRGDKVNAAGNSSSSSKWWPVAMATAKPGWGVRRGKKDRAEIVAEFQQHPLAQVTRAMSGPGPTDFRGKAAAAGKRKRAARGGANGSGCSGGSATTPLRGGLAGLVKSVRMNTLHMLHAREHNLMRAGRFSTADKCHVAQAYLPEDGPVVVDSLRSRAYIGQFSIDGSLFIAGFQDRRIRLYDVERGWALRKDVFARNLRWTITDTALSPCQQLLVYASITPVVHLVNVGASSPSQVQSHANVTDIHEELDFSKSPGGESGDGSRDRYSSSFGIWALQYSADGREIVAGGSDQSLYICDVMVNKPVLRIKAHNDDVNAVAFADEASQLIFSGSDDHLCKVWDRRAMRKRKPVGWLVGHLEGVTHISAKGDGRHFISNGKDQTIKLWDIRMMIDEPSFHSLPRAKVPTYRWDYRWMDYPGRNKSVRHPHDHALMTYTGHHVLQTLIRCYFSPLHSTGQRYIYTGSHDGSVYIFDVLTGEVVKQLKYHAAAVRDCCWHPFDAQLVSTSWDGKVAEWQHLRGECPPPSLRARCGSRGDSDGADGHDMFEW